MKNGLYYVYAEYCPGDFFWGWWLYMAPMIDGKPDRGIAKWLHADYWVSVLFRALDLPTMLDYRHTPYVKETFLQHYSTGALIEIVSFYDWQQRESDQIWEFSRQMRESQLLDWKKVLHDRNAEQAKAENE